MFLRGFLPILKEVFLFLGRFVLGVTVIILNGGSYFLWGNVLVLGGKDRSNSE